MTDYISRADAIETVCRTRCGDKAKGCPAHSCLVIEEFDAIPSADAVPTVIRAKTFMRKEDFDKLAEDIKRQNKSIVCIPCDAEVVSADAVQGEWVRKVKEYNDCDGHRVVYWYECDQCGARPPKNQWKNEWHSNFCPSCGARMKGGAEE